MKLASFVIGRTLTLLFVVWVGVSTVFVIPRLAPSSPIDAMVARMRAQRSYMSPDEIKTLRSSLADLYGTNGSLFHQYLGFLHRALVTHDFGPSLANYPAPVSSLIANALPWTLGLLLTSTILAWLIGNLIGLLAGYRSSTLSARMLEGLSMFLYPIPYYILALLLMMIFTVIFPIFPISTSVVGSGFGFDHLWSILYNSLLPGLSIVLVGIGWWVLSAKALTSEIAEEDYVQFARLKGLRDSRIMARYILPNAMLPQITVLALQLGGVFGGALITEVIFNYPGLGQLIFNAVIQNDYNLIMGSISLAVIAVAVAAFVIDLLYPLLDPRIRLR